MLWFTAAEGLLLVIDDDPLPAHSPLRSMQIPHGMRNLAWQLVHV